jgi:hypothetical protein
MGLMEVRGELLYEKVALLFLDLGINMSADLAIAVVAIGYG